MLAAASSNGVPEQQVLATCCGLAKALASQSITMPVSNPASPERRRREADALQSREHYPDHFVGGGFRFPRVRSELESMINAAEGAYLLMHDDDDYVYSLVKTLWSGYKSWSWWNTPRPGDSIYRYEFRTLDCMQRTAFLINQALQHAEHSPTTTSPLLYRADALLFAGRYQESAVLVSEHQRRYANIEKGWASEILAHVNFRLADMEKAGQYADLAVRYNHAGYFTREIIGDCEKLRAERIVKSAASTNGADVLAGYEKMLAMEGTRIEVKDWSRYLELLRQVRGPREALDARRLVFPFIHEFAECQMMQELPGQKLSSDDAFKVKMSRNLDSGNIFPVTMFHIALCDEALGERGKAVNLARSVMAYCDSVRFSWDEVPDLKDVYAAASQLCCRVESAGGSIPNPWKKAGEVRRIEDQYHLYVIPVGPFNTNVLQLTVSAVEAFLGTNSVKVLPSMPLPASAFPRESFNYACTPLFKGLFKTFSVPRDALHVVFITEMPLEERAIMCAGQMYDHDDPAELSPVVVSTVGISDLPIPRWLKARFLSKVIISSFRYLYAGMPSELQRQHQRYTKYSFNRDECMTWTCLFGTGPMDESFTQCKQLAICPKCQREYAAVDFAAIHDKLMRFLRREGVKIDDVGKAP